MNNPLRIILVLVLIAIFVILSQQLDRFTQAPAPEPPAASEQKAAPAESFTPGPADAYPAVAPTETPAGPYPPIKPTPTSTPEGYKAPSD